MDIIRPLPRIPRGHRFMLVIMDYTTHFPEVVSLRGMHAPEVARHLLHLFARVGLPRRIMTDQGRLFTSDLVNVLPGPGSPPEVYSNFLSTNGRTRRALQSDAEGNDMEGGGGPPNPLGSLLGRPVICGAGNTTGVHWLGAA